MYYPIILRISDRKILVAGGGEVAEAKVAALLASGARVTVVSPEVTPELLDLAESGAIAWIEREYETSDIKDAFIVIAATDNRDVQERVWRDARDHRVLVNTVDEPERCDFIMPGVLRRDDLIVAVSTSGKSPAFAAWLQRRLAQWITADFGRVVSLLGNVRDDVRRRFQTISERKRAYQGIIDTDIVNWIRHCDDVTAKARVHHIIKDL